MKISPSHYRTLIVGVGISGTLHILFWAASPKVLGSAIEFFFWPALLAAVALNSILPSSIAVQYDPLPHPAVWWVAVPINFIFWASLIYCVIVALKIGIQRKKI